MSIRALCIGGVLIAISVSASDLKPGVDRWGVKTTVSKDQFKTNGTPKKVSKIKLDDLLNLAPPDPQKYNYKTFDAQTTGTERMRGQDSKRPQEGDIVQIEGYVQLVMLSREGPKHRDGDYHVQVTSDVNKRANCLIVEVPFEDFVTDSNIPDEAALRDTLRKKLKPTSGEFATSGSCMVHPPRMAITGQLFYDVHHAAGSPRGRHGCKSPTEWELHPVFKMKFLDPAGTSPDVGKCPK
jgi:hypothetical protein